MKSHQPSNSTGKERDAESGNDYFEARYYRQVARSSVLKNDDEKLCPVHRVLCDERALLLRWWPDEDGSMPSGLKRFQAGGPRPDDHSKSR